MTFLLEKIQSQGDNLKLLSRYGGAWMLRAALA
jgi:hypothetical protein